MAFFTRICLKKSSGEENQYGLDGKKTLTRGNKIGRKKLLW